MADMSKLKRRNSLGDPPPPDAAGQNLAAPEVAPPAEQQRVVAFRSTPPPTAAPEIEEELEHEAPRPRKPAKARRIDGRSLRKTGRTVQFSSRVSEKWDMLLRETAKSEQVLLVEILEKSLDMYVAAKSKKK